MPYQLDEKDPTDQVVRELTLIPFRSDGTCIAIEAVGGRLTVPTGTVLADESWMLDAALRIPLETAGFRMQRLHPFAVDDLDSGNLHVYTWIDGDRYAGPREHVDAVWHEGTIAEVAERLAEQGDVQLAAIVRDAGRSFSTQDDAGYYADNLRLLEPAYLQAATPEGGSGAGGTPQQWRERREMIVDGFDRDGTFLDLGCANGLLMESVHAWAAERGLDIEPYGVDIGPRLVDLARKRLPQWADRIEVGNAIDYVPASGQRFTYVHVLSDTVPPRRLRDLLEHVLTHLVEPGGRLLTSVYRSAPGPSAADLVRDLGLPVAGEAASVSGRHTTAWLW